jgi:tetratricopeptide (TPR) repeat protein
VACRDDDEGGTGKRGAGGAAGLAVNAGTRHIAGAVALAVVVTLSGCSRFVILNDALTAAEHNDLGVAYERQGNFDLAGREYRRALRRDSRFTRARVNLGNLSAARGRWPEAERTYRRALADSPADADALNNLAIALLRQRRRLEEAEALALRAVTAAGAADSIPRATLGEVRAARAPRRD